MPKHQAIRESLIASIRNGEFQPQSRLPSERELAERFGVSYLTARRAVSDLVEANVLERRPRSGTFVRNQGDRRLATTTVHLICTAEDRALNRSFLRIASRLLAERDWHAQLIRLSVGDERPAVRALADGALAIVLLEGVERIDLQTPDIAEALTLAQGRAVLLANRMDHLGVPSVVADDTHTVRMAVTHLREQGHRQIALLSDRPDHPVARVQIATWRSACATDASPETLRQRLIAVHPTAYEDLHKATYEAVRTFLRSEAGQEVTALISLVDEMVIPALAACRREGRPVPGEFAMVSLGDSALLAYVHPPMTCVDVDLEQHIEHALDMLQLAQQGAIPAEDRLRLVEPRLVIRQSVLPLSATSDKPHGAGPVSG